MIDAKNVVILTCGIVADPEMPHENIMKLRVAADYSGDEKGSDNRSGYFDVTYFFNEGDMNSDFVRRQIKEGKMKKGSQVQLVGSLRQRRWQDAESGKNRSAVDVRAESITYATSNRRTDDEGNTATAAPAANTAVPDEF